MRTGILRFKKLPKTLELIGAPHEFPIIEGSHKYDFDVREDLLDEKVLKNLREDAEMRYAVTHGDLPAGAFNKPMGFSMEMVKRAGGEIIWDEQQ